MPYMTPIVLIVFNRPDTTRQVFDIVRKMRPLQLFVIADGARKDKEGEADLCKEVRDIVSQVDWSCQLSTDFSEENMGLRNRITSGLNNVFKSVDRAVILEDDIIADDCFFKFCEELLDYYENDKRRMSIGGGNFQFGQSPMPYSYYFSNVMHCWGWARWKRAWELDDPSMPFWQELKADGWLENILPDPYERQHWTACFDAVHNGTLNSWAYQWTYSIWRQNALSIIPSVNLASNIGFGEGATHTIGKKSILENIPRKTLNFPLEHPSHMVRNFTADSSYIRAMFKPHRSFKW